MSHHRADWRLGLIRGVTSIGEHDFYRRIGISLCIEACDYIFTLKMPKRCVVAGCDNVTDKEKGISLHRIPYLEDERPEAKKRRKKWVDFVNLKRAKWTPTPHSVICSEYFKPEDFTRRFSHVEGEGEPLTLLAIDGLQKTRLESAYSQQ